MQNIDFYSGHPHGHNQPDFVTRDPEYFSRMAKNQHKDGVKKKNKATRLLSLVLGLCIVSFTSGLVVGIKFTGGTNEEIVDSQTKEAMHSLGTKVGSLVKDSETQGAQSSETTDTAAVKAESDGTAETAAATQGGVEKKQSFPKEEYPYVIRIGNKFSETNAMEIAEYLKNKGHTVILSKHEGFLRIYTGPYKTQHKADTTLNRINYYTDNKLFHNAIVLKR